MLQKIADKNFSFSDYNKIKHFKIKIIVTFLQICSALTTKNVTIVLKISLGNKEMYYPNNFGYIKYHYARYPNHKVVFIEKL